MKRNPNLIRRITEADVADICDVLLILCVVVMVILAALAAVDLLSPDPAAAAVDDAGRPWFGTVALSAAPAADQFVGVQFAQVRRGLPGAWLDARAGGGRRSAFGGIVVRLADCVALRAGAGVDAVDGDLAVEAAGGATFAWRRLAAHAGIDSGTGALSCGAGVTFWR
jgi:hypothetical protein